MIIYLPLILVQFVITGIMYRKVEARHRAIYEWHMKGMPDDWDWENRGW